MKKLDSAEKMIGGIFLLLIIGLSFIQVVTRKFGHALAWSEEYALICFLWFGYLGASACALEKKHLRIDMVVSRLPHKVGVVWELVVNVLWIVVNAMIGYAGFQYMMSNLTRSAATLITKTPYWVVIAAVPVGFLLMSIRILQNCYRLIKAEWGKDKKEAKE